MTHTPGPWRYEKRKGCKPIRVAGTGTLIAYTADQLEEKEDLANAHLIAAAPKMYDLLNEWLDTPFFETKEEWQKWVDDYRPRVEQAIAKAEGK